MIALLLVYAALYYPNDDTTQTFRSSSTLVITNQGKVMQLVNDEYAKGQDGTHGSTMHVSAPPADSSDI